MKALAALLSISAAGFIGSTVYLGVKLHDLRSRGIAEQAPVYERAVAMPRASYQEPAGSGSGSGSDGGGGGVQTSDRSAPAVGPPNVASAESRRRERRREASAAFMKRYEDPVQRAEMLDVEKAALRRNTRKFGDVAGLSEDELDQLLDLLAQNRLERVAAGHACTLDSECDPEKYSFPDGERQVAAVAAYLGPERYQKYQEFRMAAPERGLVERLRERVVTSSVLRDADAERLISALWDERRRYLEDAERRGLHLMTHETSGVPVIMRTNAEGTERLLSAETLEFRRRMDARASQILSAEQLREFKELQDQALRGAYNFRMGSPAAPASTPATK